MAAEAGRPIALPRPIRSAETVAALRAAVTRDRSLAVPCRDPFAHHFLRPGHRALTQLVPPSLLRRLLERLAPGSYAFAVARTQHFDRLLCEAIAAGAEQVVVLGAGYDSRARRWAEALRAIPVYEIDHPGTQARKRRILARLPTADAGNVVYLPVDFASQSLTRALTSAGFLLGRRSFFLWEGVSYYLPRAAVVAILDLVGACAPGSSIGFDYALARFVNGDHGSYGGRQVARWLRKIGEPFRFGLDPGDTRSFLRARGLELLSDWGPEESEQAYLARHDGGRVGRTLGHVRFAHAQVPARATGAT